MKCTSLFSTSPVNGEVITALGGVLSTLSLNDVSAVLLTLSVALIVIVDWSILPRFFISAAAILKFHVSPFLGPSIVLVPIVSLTLLIPLAVSYLGLPSLLFVPVAYKSFASTVTGRLLYPISDLFIVQWESMKKLYPDSVFGGWIF